MVTAAWLADREQLYGGPVVDVSFNASPHDPYGEVRKASGGERMAVGPASHGYAPAYSVTLSEFCVRVGKRPDELTIAEVGVLRGTGLAMWCDLFGAVYGFDIDLSNFHAARHELVARGAFRKREPVVHQIDQFKVRPEDMLRLLRGVVVDIVIDDGAHVDAATLNTIEAFRPVLAQHFLYFVEDQPRHSRIHTLLEREPPVGMKARRLHKSLSVLTRRGA